MAKGWAREFQNFGSRGRGVQKKSGFLKKIQKFSPEFWVQGGGVQKKILDFWKKSRNPEFWISGFSFLLQNGCKNENPEIQNSGFLDFFQKSRIFFLDTPPLDPKFWTEFLDFFSEIQIFFLDPPPLDTKFWTGFLDFFFLSEIQIFPGPPPP